MLLNVETFAYLDLLWRQIPAGDLLLIGSVCQQVGSTLRTTQKQTCVSAPSQAPPLQLR